MPLCLMPPNGATVCTGNSKALCGVPREEVGCQPEGRVVGEVHALLFRGEGGHAHDGAKDLLSSDAHRRLHVDEQTRRIEVCAVEARFRVSRQLHHLGALRNGAAD
eukprot:scaffold2875_cov247-Pinguiococcus_pyrenoidosus.AAC.15